MGLGGYLTWTALAREVNQRHGLKVIPVEQHGNITKLIKSEAFYNNPNIIQSFEETHGLVIQLNNPVTNYCLKDTPTKAIHRSDKHIIQTICDPYGIKNPILQCEIFLDSKERESVGDICKNLPVDFITIEPTSKDNYTPNRMYPLDKWQKFVNEIYKKIPVVQIGLGGNVLKNVIDLTGKTTFREASGVIDNSKLFVSSEGGLGHAATATSTKSLIVVTGYQTEKMIGYPQNININISNHGPCGLKIECNECKKEAQKHDFMELVKVTKEFLCL